LTVFGKRELTEKEQHRLALKAQWKIENDSIKQEYEKNPSGYKLGWSELPPGIVKGSAKWSYSALYRPPLNFRRCRSCNAYLTSQAWYVDLDMRERCKLCFSKVVGPQWSRADASRPLEHSHCVVIYTQAIQ